MHSSFIHNKQKLKRTPVALHRELDIRMLVLYIVEHCLVKKKEKKLLIEKPG
jgi:hypothetical protein